MFAPDDRPRTIDLTAPGGEAVGLRVEGRIASNNQFALQQMCLAGLGIARMVLADIADDLRAGRLAIVLPAWRASPIAAWAVTPQRDAQPAKVRASIEALGAYLDSMQDLEATLRGAAS